MWHIWKRKNVIRKPERGDHLGDRRYQYKNKANFKRTMRECGLRPIGTGQEIMMGFCERGNEPITATINFVVLSYGTSSFRTWLPTFR